MTIRALVLEELLVLEPPEGYRVPGLAQAVLQRADLTWWQRLYFTVLWGDLYRVVRSMEERGQLERFPVPSAHTERLQLTAWRVSPALWSELGGPPAPPALRPPRGPS